MAANEAQCGTNSGYKKHARNGEKPCDSCRSAWNEYMRKYPYNEEQKTERAIVKRARLRAARRLELDFPTQFWAYYQEELEKARREGRYAAR